jgi:hypothetical protein
MHAGLDRPDGNAKASRHLWQPEPEVVVKHQHGALLDGEPPKRTLQLVSMAGSSRIASDLRRRRLASA